MKPTTTISKWWRAKSVTFSRIGDGDEFTHGQVIVAHVVMIVFIILCIIISGLEGGAA